MLNKHFLKSVLGFAAILALGLVVLFVLNEFDKSNASDIIETKAIDSRQP